MAQEISPEIEKQYKFPKLAHLHVLARLHPLRSRIRQSVQGLLDRQHQDDGVACAITDSLEQAKGHYQEHGWALLQDIIDPEFHRSLLRQWPNWYYFKPVQNVFKGYDYGFSWSTASHTASPALPHFPAVQKFFDYVRSPEFATRVTDFTCDNVPRHCHSVLMTRAYHGSSVIPHRDSVTHEHHLNFIFFIAGTGGKRSGGLMIMNDNEYRDVVIEPTNLTNCCMVYDMSAPFYHGFPPMKFGSYRKAIGVHFGRVPEAASAEPADAQQ